MKQVLLLLLLPVTLTVTAFAQQQEICNNGIDDDGDGKIDCADMKCASLPGCSSESAGNNCSDGIDNDDDGQVDCADSDCNCTPVEICNNGIDDDGDGLADCEDDSCTASSSCQIEICDNGIDDDNDGFIDYYDGDCLATPRQRDSLALVALYHATDGDNWTRNDNWLVGPMDSWYAIQATNGVVHSINLWRNNLRGSLPSQINNLHDIRYFDFEDNTINSIPVKLFSNSPDMSHGNIGRNQLTFEDFLTQSRDIFKSQNQQLIGKDTTVIMDEGESYTIHLNIDPDVTTNRYVWFKDNIAFDTTDVNRYILGNVTTDDTGIYTCRVTNPNSIVDLILYSHPTELQVTTTRQPQTILFESLANRTFGDSSFALVASASSNLPISYRVTEGEGTVVSLQNGMVTLVGAGEAAIEASQSGDENYLPATPVVREFKALKASQHITFADLDDALVGDTLPLQATATSQLPVSFSIIGPARLMEDQLLFTDTGQVTITVHQAGDNRYAAAESVSQTIRVTERLKTSTHYALSGQVWQEENILYQGEATVFLYRVDQPFRLFFYSQQLDESRTYRFDSLEAGDYTLGVLVRDTSYLPTYWGGHYLLFNADPIQLGQDTTLDITLLTAPVLTTRGTAIIRGRLVGAPDNGRTTEIDQALADIHVYLRNAQTGELVAHTVTDENGEFAFTQLPEGEYSFVADYEGLAATENTLRVREGQETVIAVTATDQIAVTWEEETITAVRPEITPDAIQVFPNPATDKLVVEITGTQWIGGTVRLRNILGNTLDNATIQHSFTTFDMSAQKTGVYVLTISRGNQIATYKVIK